MSRETLAIGCAAGFGGDRTDAGGPIVETLIARGGPGVLIYEVLAERTLALAQMERRRDPERGYAPLLEPMLRPILARCVRYGIPVVGNFGVANPIAAAHRIRQIAREEGVPDVRIAIVEGDDLSNADGRERLRFHLSPVDAAREVVSANAYLGAEGISSALMAGAQVVVTGRVADPSLVVGPALAHFGWDAADWTRLGCATIAGHLIECGAQVTGGYFADPGLKDVPDLHLVGFPIVEIADDGSLVVTKAAHTGGVVDCRTVKEQLLYEVHDPAAYLTPDVVADISEAEVRQLGPDRVAVTGVRGHPRPATLKVIAFFEGGWLGEGEISYIGPNAAARARLAAEIVRQRVGGDVALRTDLIGAISAFGDSGNAGLAEPASADFREVRLRVAAAHAERDPVERVLREVTALYTCGPAGGGGVRTALTPRLSSASCFVPRDEIPASSRFVE